MICFFTRQVFDRSFRIPLIAGHILHERKALVHDLQKRHAFSLRSGINRQVR